MYNACLKLNKKINSNLNEYEILFYYQKKEFYLFIKRAQFYLFDKNLVKK